MEPLHPSLDSAQTGGPELVATCRAKAIELLRDNLSPEGILAAKPSTRSTARGYSTIFGRDAAVCAIGMALSGDGQLQREASTGLVTLATQQAANGQIPNFFDARAQEADFWYLGCIDATLWWLIALDFLERRDPALGLRQRLAPEVAKAIQWLGAQEHQRFFLLQQNEASDWADIMPRSGFVLYTNALWYRVKQLHGIPRAGETRASFNQLFHPFSAGRGEYRRARLLAHYTKRGASNRDLYLSFINFSFFGDEGDVFGNLLALLCGLADREAQSRTLGALDRAGVAEPWPVRVVCEPIPAASLSWRPYMSRHRQNFEWQYHNGGIWPFVGGFWVTALMLAGEPDSAERELTKLARVNALENWSFPEWLHGRTFAPSGMRGQSWNAAAFLMALDAVQGGTSVFARCPDA
jgi:glycosyl hydrolase family 100 (putative invertase)/amylo-alpha-1,6-glucosidase